jgi:chemotaxis signal transduction protein
MIKKALLTTLGVALTSSLMMSTAQAGEVLDKVKAKGFVQCGVSQGLPGFSNTDVNGEWSGLDVDFCRAVAAAIFGDASKVKYSPLSASERFTALQSGEIDMLSRNTTWTQTRDTSLGINFAAKLKLPLTLAIIEGMMIDVGQQVFTIPLLSVNESLRPVSSQIKKIKNKGELVEIRGEYIPLLRLHDRLNIIPKFKEPTEGLVVVLQHANHKQCILVDGIVDQGPVVIKSMEDNFIQVPGIAGATILGDGKVSFILDVASLVN